MKDPLQDLADDILKSRARPVVQSQPQRAPQPQQQRVNNDRVVKGVGGVVFSFGDFTGNPVADRTTALLRQFADPTQSQVAAYQQASMRKSIVNYVETGSTSEQKLGAGEHPEWQSQFTKSLDQQVVDAIKSGEISVENDKGMSTNIRGDFNKSQMTLGGEEIIAQSETDAAVIEMMKSMQDQETSDDEFIIDATKGS